MTTIRLDPSGGAGTSAVVSSPGEKRPETAGNGGFAALLVAAMGLAPQTSGPTGQVQAAVGGSGVTGTALARETTLSGVAAQTGTANPAELSTGFVPPAGGGVSGDQPALASITVTDVLRESIPTNGQPLTPLEGVWPDSPAAAAGVQQSVSGELIQQAPAGDGAASAATVVAVQQPAVALQTLPSDLLLPADAGGTETLTEAQPAGTEDRPGAETVTWSADHVSGDLASPVPDMAEAQPAADSEPAVESPGGAVTEMPDPEADSPLVQAEADGDGLSRQDARSDEAGQGGLTGQAIPETSDLAGITSWAPGSGEAAGEGQTAAAVRETPAQSASGDFQYVVEEPVTADQAMDVVVESLQGARDGEYAITLRLQPEHLGEVKIQLQLTGREVQTRFEVTTPEARQLLQQHGELLREDLQEAGFTLSGFTVSTGGGTHQGLDRWDLEEWLRQGRADATPVAAARSAAPQGQRAVQPRHVGILDRLA